MILKRAVFSIAFGLILSFTISCVVAPPPKRDVISPETQIKEAESSKQVKLMNERILMSTLATTYIQQNLESRFIATQQAKEWLTGRLEDLKAKVERADEALQAFGSKHDIISLEERENVTMQRLTELNQTLTKAESERMSKEVLSQVNAKIFGVVINRIDIQRSDYGYYYYRYQYYYGKEGKKKEIPYTSEEESVST